MEEAILKVLKELMFTDMTVSEAHKEIMSIINPKPVVEEVLILGTAPEDVSDVCSLCKYKGFCQPDIFEQCIHNLKPNQYYK